MIYTIFLHPYVENTLKMFGPLEEVVNKIVDLGMEGEQFTVYDKPTCPDKIGARHRLIEVHNDEYNENVKISGITSPKFSLRRLLYWFVDDAIYDDLGWTPLNEYKDEDRLKFNKSKQLATLYIEKMLNVKESYELKQILSQLKEIKYD